MLAARFVKTEDRQWLRFFAVAGGILCFLMLRDAEWIWDALPLLQYVEFPWRILLPVTICMALLVGAFARVCGAVAALSTGCLRGGNGAADSAQSQSFVSPRIT